MSIAKESMQPASLSTRQEIRFTKRHFFAVFLVFAAVVFLAFQVFLSIRYKNDSYSHLAMTQIEIAKLHLGGYRFIPALNMLLYLLANVKDVDAQILNTICLLVGLSLSASILFLSLCKRLGSLSRAKLALLVCAVTLVFVNPFIAAMALFPETGMFMSLGYLFATLAAVFTARKPSLGNILVSFVLLSCALGTYQALLGIFCFAAFTLLIAEHGLTLNRETLKRTIILVLTAGIASIANILFGKGLCNLFGVVQNTRTDGFSIQRVFTNLIELLHQQYSLWYDLLNTTPRFLGALVCLFLMLLVIIGFLTSITRKIREKTLTLSKMIVDILYCCFVFTFCYVVIFAPFMLATTSGIIPRGILSFFCVFLMLAVMLIRTTDLVWQHLVSAVAVGVLLLFCMFGVNRIGVEQNMVNALDMEYAKQVIAKIEAYEHETGENVEKISFINDENPNNSYKAVDRYCAPYSMLNKSARVIDFSQINLISKYSGRDLERVPMPEDLFEAHFEGKDWGSFVPEEQIYFEGDTVYIASY